MVDLNAGLFPGYYGAEDARLAHMLCLIACEHIGCLFFAITHINF